MGDWDWRYSVWAHNSYTEITGAAVAGVTGGKYFTFTEGSYSAVWFVPNAFLTPNRRAPNQRVKDAVARDITTGMGNTLQTKVNELRTAWNGLTSDARYGGELDHVQRLLDNLNALREAAGGTRFTLDDYDNLTNPDPEGTPNPTSALGQAWVAFKGARSRARGNVIHDQLRTWIRDATGPANVGYHTTGPDLDEHGSSSLTAWYEVYPAGGDNRMRHANRAGMSSAPWREILYGNGR